MAMRKTHKRHKQRAPRPGVASRKAWQSPHKKQIARAGAKRYCRRLLCEVDHRKIPDALTYGHMDNLCEADHMPTLPLALAFKSFL